MISELRSVFSGAGVSIIGLVLIAISIWWFGPYIGFGSLRPLESELARIVVIVLVFVAWAVFKLLKRRAAAKADAKLATDLVESGDQSSQKGADRSADEVAVLKQRFEEAIETLRASSKKRSSLSLYELPWFVIIGPPGAGKTTALVNSGLEFPLEQRFGKEALRGVGGTRNCDWWFTNDAVLLDTAGRYVTQDSDQATDRAAWLGFLDLLKNYRKRQPINGVIVAISLSDLLLQSESERNAEVLAIRQRIQELYRHFGIRFPVYMVFTKCDLIAGFIEFFDDLDQSGREQVWGTTFPLQESKSGGRDDVERFRDELSLLQKRLDDRMIWRLSQERDQRRRSKIYSFPSQIAALADTLDRFLRDAFSSSRFEDRILLRGVYFTSGTQEGTPIDRMLAAISRTFGVAEQVAPSFGGKGRSYFITDLFRKIIFQESGLAGVNRRVERRIRWLQSAAYAGAVALIVIAGSAWITSFTANRAYLGQVETALAQYQEQAAAAGPRQTLDDVLPPLDALRNVLDVAAQHESSPPWHMRMWLYQGEAVSERVRDAYRRALNESLGPTVMSILETRIRENAGNSQLLYEYLKAYMMLGNPERLESRQLIFLMDAEWRRSYPSNSDVFARLKRHSDFLFEQVPPYPVSDRLIAGAQSTLAQAPLSDFLYSRLLLDATSLSREDLVLTDVLGLGFERIFRRKSRAPLSEPISVLYTRRGFNERYPALVVQLIAEAGKENWVLGRQDETLSIREIADIESQLRDRYIRDYIATWRTLLGDLEIIPFGSESQAMATLDIVAAQPSVLRELLDVVADNTDLGAGGAPGGENDAVAEAAGGGSQSRLSRIFGDNAPAVPQLPGVNLGEPIATAFASVNRLVVGDSAPINQLLLLVEDLLREIEATSGAGQTNALSVIAGGGGAAARRLRTETRRLEEPVRSWFETIGGSSENLTTNSARSELTTRFNNRVLSECRRLIAGRYPFDRNSGNDVAIDDFAAMFGHGGVLDTFFQENLENLVDRSGEQWRARSGAALQISPAALQQFRNAERIRETYFRPGSRQPEINLTMTTTSLDPEVRRFVFEANGQSFDYQHGPLRPTAITWPGEGVGAARIMFEEASGGRPTAVENGPWALFRLLDDSQVTRVSDIEYDVRFAVGGRNAVVNVQARSVDNPLSGVALYDFRCPDSL